jgi:hypothetical protein
MQKMIHMLILTLESHLLIPIKKLNILIDWEIHRFSHYYLLPQLHLTLKSFDLNQLTNSNQLIKPHLIIMDSQLTAEQVTSPSNAQLTPEQIANLTGEQLVAHFRSKLDMKAMVCAEPQVFADLLSAFLNDAQLLPETLGFVATEDDEEEEDDENPEPEIPLTPEQLEEKERKAKVHAFKIKQLAMRIGKVFDYVDQKVQPNLPARKTWDEISVKVGESVKQRFNMEHMKDFPEDKREVATRYLSRIHSAQVVLHEFSAELSEYHTGFLDKLKDDSEYLWNIHWDLFMALRRSRTDAIYEAGSHLLIYSSV